MLIAVVYFQSVGSITSITSRRHSGDVSQAYLEQKKTCLKCFDDWSESEQVEFVQHVLSRMCHHQHGQVDNFLKPMLQRDFICALPGLQCIS
jgi:F-box and WD-40 domain protein 1/11